MKKILIMYATFGNGHRAIAKYIEEYFKSRDEEIEIKNIDILSYITPFINKISTKVSNKMILSSNPLVWGLVYKYFDVKTNKEVYTTTLGGSNEWDRKNTKRKANSIT